MYTSTRIETWLCARCTHMHAYMCMHTHTHTHTQLHFVQTDSFDRIFLLMWWRRISVRRTVICSYAVNLAKAHLIVVTASFPVRMTSLKNCAMVIFCCLLISWRYAVWTSGVWPCSDYIDILYVLAYITLDALLLGKNNLWAQFLYFMWSCALKRMARLSYVTESSWSGDCCFMTLLFLWWLLLCQNELWTQVPF